MAADLDLTRPGSQAQSRALQGLALVLMGVGALTVFLWLVGWAAIVLLGCVVAGAGLTYLSGLPLTPEERLAFGAVIGAATFAILAFLLALAMGLSLATVLAGLILALALAAPGWWRARTSVRAELADAAARWRRLEPWPLWLLLLASWPYVLAWLGHAYRFEQRGLVVGGGAVFADWAAHLSYAGSFAYANNFPPEFPIDPGHRMTYAFMVDFLAATLVPLGTSLTSSLVLSSALLCLAFPAVMYLAGLRLLGSRAGAGLAVLVFVLSGGIGFLAFFADVARLGPGILTHLPHLYTQNYDENYQWLNPVLAWLLPQRSTLFGFSLALLVMATLWTALRQAEGSPGRRLWAPFAFAGVLTGMSPVLHLHGYGTIVALAGFWALLSRRREWAAFFVPALALGAPIALWLASGGAASLRLHVWWLANSDGHQDGPLWFWFKNTGLLVPLMAAGFLWRGLLPPRLALHLAPIWLWFLVPNVFVLQPWDWDNTKFFSYWLLFGALPVGALLARLLSRRPAAKLLGCALAVSLMLAGALDLARSLDTSVSGAIFTDRGGVRVANWVRANTDRSSVFLVAPEHNHPVSTLGGRRVVVGYPGWLWTYGLPDWGTRAQDAETMLKGGPRTPELVQRYEVSYVVIGPAEANLGANAGYWRRVGERVYADANYTVYRLR